MQNQQNGYDKESTTKASHSRTADASVNRLRRRYPNIDFNKCIRDLCEFLKGRADPDDWFNTYTVALRSLDPDIGAIGMNNYNLQVAAYFWMLANDHAPKIARTSDESIARYFGKKTYGLFFNIKSEIETAQTNLTPVQTKLEHLAYLMYEVQREKNIQTSANATGFRDNGEREDQIACLHGVVNNFCTGFTGMDQDIEVIKDDLVGIIFDLIKGFAANYCHSVHGITLNSLATDEVDLITLVPEHVRADIKAKIMKCMGGCYDDAKGLGLMSKAQINYLDSCLKDDMFQNLMDAFSGNADDMQLMIDYAVEKLRKANAAATTFNGYQAAMSRFDANHLRDIIRNQTCGTPMPSQFCRNLNRFNPNDDTIIIVSAATTVLCAAYLVNRALRY